MAENISVVFCFDGEERRSETVAEIVQTLESSSNNPNPGKKLRKKSSKNYIRSSRKWNDDFYTVAVDSSGKETIKRPLNTAFTENTKRIEVLRLDSTNLTTYRPQQFSNPGTSQQNFPEDPNLSPGSVKQKQLENLETHRSSSGFYTITLSQVPENQLPKSKVSREESVEIITTSTAEPLQFDPTKEETLHLVRKISDWFGKTPDESFVPGTTEKSPESVIKPEIIMGDAEISPSSPAGRVPGPNVVPIIERSESILSNFRPEVKETEEFRQRVSSELCGGDATEKEIRLFQMYADQDGDGLMSVGRILTALEERGLYVDDPRLKPMVDKFRQYAQAKSKSSQDIYSLEVDKDQFLEAVPDCLLLLLRCLRSQLIIPDWPDFCDQIEKIFNQVKKNDTGKNADYIPQLARVDPNQWGVSVCSVDGQRAHWGDTTVPFCIQSVSKAFNYATALGEHGPEFVHKYIGQEPSGRAFNAIELDKNDRPHNPLINAGAIVTSSLIKMDEELAERFEYTVEQYKRFAGNGYVGFDNAVYQSEKSTADRNFSLAYFMRENKCFPKGTDLVKTLELYFQLCSVLVNTQSASVMAATLANGGVCPLTGDKVIEGNACRNVLSLMYSCGMYDYSGQFAFKVGLPAKSGVGGLILTVVPNTMGIATWSPRLDDYGNSVRGVMFNEELIERFNFHNYDLVVDELTLPAGEDQPDGNGSYKPIKCDPRKSRISVKKEMISNFLFAASAGDRGAMKALLLQGVNVNQCDYDHRTPLHVAAADGRIGAVEFLLRQAHADPHRKDRWNRTPLDEAISFKHEKCVELLKKYMNK